MQHVFGDLFPGLEKAQVPLSGGWPMVACGLNCPASLHPKQSLSPKAYLTGKSPYTLD